MRDTEEASGADEPQPAAEYPGCADITLTTFYDHAAGSKTERCYSWGKLAAEIAATDRPTKSQLPWMKLARFGDVRSPKGSLRHDANVLAITGIEVDYDGEVMAPDEAVERLEKAGVSAMVYTSPSHTDTAPRWRILCPTSTELPPVRRAHLVGRLNGLFGGIFAAESFTLSQAYYYGSVAGNPAHQVVLVDGRPIDTHDDLDECWIGKPNTLAVPAFGGLVRSGPLDVSAAIKLIIDGVNYHQNTVRLAGHFARSGTPYLEARQTLHDAMEAVFPPDRDARWHSRRDDIDRVLEDIYGKEAIARDAGASRPASPCNVPSCSDAWPPPIDFLADADLTGVPLLATGHVPAPIYAYAHDVARRLGVDPVSVALAGIVSCSSVMNEAWRVQPKQHDDTWTERPRLWGGIVGAPSILKTPIIVACTKPIDRLDQAAREQHAIAMREHQIALAVWKEAGSDPETVPLAPRMSRYIVEGTTVEALSEVLRTDDDARYHAVQGKVLCRQDELSEWVASFDRYRSGGRGGADRGAYLRLYNGGRYIVDRVNRGGFAIPNWSACILGGIQPGPIQKIARDAADDGLLQRFMFCVPAGPQRGEDRLPDRQALAGYENLFPALVALHPASGLAVGSNDGEGPRAIVLHADAHHHRIAIDQLIEAMSSLPDTSARLQAAFGKWHGLFARLALTFHLIEIADSRVRHETGQHPGVISEATAAMAASFMRDILLPHLLRADAVMFSTEQTGHARWIAGFILARGEARVALRDIVQAYGALRAPESRRELLQVMESLVTVGWLMPEEPANPARPPSAWRVNPMVHEQFAARAAVERERRQRVRRDIGVTLSKLPSGRS